MHFEWDNLKNKSNIQKHGIDFIDATRVFDHPILTLQDKYSYAEERWVSLGWMDLFVKAIKPE